MIPVGYMYKKVCQKPVGFNNKAIKDIYSVSSCMSQDFDDWAHDWKHNGYWLFDSPEIMESIAVAKRLDLSGMKLFYYMASEKQWNEDDKTWDIFLPEKSFTTDIKPPKQSILEGFDVVSFYANTQCECSPLSCNRLAESFKTNAHCLLDTYDEAIGVLNSGSLKDCEPGPYRIFAVYSVVRT